MQKAKLETSAERYRRIKSERLAKAELADFTSPSGMEWKLRPLDLQLFITSGLMPVEMATKVAEMQEADPSISNQDAFQNLDPKNKFRSIEFAANVVRYCAVDPKIVETPSASDEIGYAEVEMDDFNAILLWALQGGGKAEALGSFRQQ